MKKLLIACVCIFSLLLSSPAFAHHAIPYHGLDSYIACAWNNGKLTSWEINEINRLQRVADRTHRNIDRDHTVNTFIKYRDNGHYRFVPRPVIVVHSHPRPVVKVVLHRSHNRHHNSHRRH